VKIRSVLFEGSFTDVTQPLPDVLPQVAFAGRSNVGKSSLINRLLRRNRKKVAKVSGQPGKTQTLNFYRVNDQFHLVDLPGFGFAKVPKSVRDAWKGMIERYLSSERAPQAVVHLVDARRDPSQGDLDLLEYLSSVGIPTMIVLTKMDKLSGNQRARAVEKAAEALSVDPEQILACSSVTGEGREELLEAIAEVLELPAEAAETPEVPAQESA